MRAIACVLAGFSVACLAENDSVTSPPAARASPVGVELKSRFFWVFFCRMSFLRSMSYSPLLSFGPSILVPGSAYRFLHLSVFGVPQYPCRRQDLLCPMLTSALRSGCLSTSSVTEVTHGSSPGVSSTALRAQSPDLPSPPLLEVDSH